MITENLSTLKIHKLTQAQYDRELEAGRIDENAMYLTPEEEITPEQIGARPDTWVPTAAEVGAAPDGYGLGGDMRYIDISEIDTLKRTGWYLIDTPSGGSILGGVRFSYAFCRVIGDGYNCTQELFPIQTTIKIMRTKFPEAGIWSDWFANDWEHIMTSANFSYSNGTLSITT